MKARLLALLGAAALLFTLEADAGTITADQKYQLNHMNSVASKIQLGTLIDNISLGAAPLNSGLILVGNGANAAAAVAASGDLTLANTGAFTIGANKVGVSKLNTDAIAEATGTLTQANLQACHSGAIALIASPGAGKLLVVDSVEMFHSYSTAVYAAGGDLVLEYTGATAILDMDKSLATAGASETWFSKPSTYNLDGSTGTAAGGMQVDTQANKGLEILCAAADFTLGNVANVLKWRIRYHIVTLLT